MASRNFGSAIYHDPQRVALSTNSPYTEHVSYNLLREAAADNSHPLRLKFFGKVAEPDERGCRLWLGIKQKGYGRFPIRGKLWIAPRVAYFLHHGDIPRDGELDHLCVNPPCVEVSHLDHVYQFENKMRGASRRAEKRAAERKKRKAEHRFTCSSGHEITIGAQDTPYAFDPEFPPCLTCAAEFKAGAVT